jgi:hypothetical protein
MTGNFGNRSTVAIGLGVVLIFAIVARPTAAQVDGSIVVQAIDQDGNRLPGGCYLAEGPEVRGPVCDNGPYDHDADEATVDFGDLPPGDWIVSEIEAPYGYRTTGDPSHLVAVDPGETALVVFEYAPIEDGGDPHDPDFEPVARPTAELFEPVPVTPPPQIFLAPSCAGVKATIVVATSANGAPTKVFGTNGNDVIVGTAGPDQIDGRGGHDLICSLDGADAIQGGDGNDWIDGGPGDDTLAGATGEDYLNGSFGKRDACDGGTTPGGFENDIALGCETTAAIP